MKRKTKRKPKFRLKHFILLFLIFWFSKTLISQSVMIKELSNKKAQEEKEIAQLEKEIKELNEAIKNKDSLLFIEKVAREDLGMVRPRELIYVDKNKDKHRFNFFNK